MKILLILFLSLATFHYASAQQKSKTNYMIVTIEDYDYKLNMVVTRTDSAQLQKHVQLHRDMKITTSESALLQTLKPYFDNDWKLVSTMAQRDPTTKIALYRFFLQK